MTPEARAQGAGLEDYLASLFPHSASGLIEIRMIVDEPGGEFVAGPWYESPADLLDDLDELRQLAEQRSAGIFIGVLPRLDRSSGAADNVAPGFVAWADLDFKDYAGGEAEARTRLAAFPIPPSIIVRSGHGLHAYWLLREPTAPNELSVLSRRLAGVLGADHAFDAARILRLPGTFNRKDPSNPILVEVELIEPERAYNASEIEEAVTMYREAEAPKGDGPDLGDIKIGSELPATVRAVLLKRPRIANFFNGEGKPGYGLDGQRLDKSSSGYDFSLLMALVREGITNASDLATTLACRPDGGAREKGEKYIERTVAKVLSTMAEADATVAQATLNFEVGKVRVFDSNPARFELTINGQPVVLGSADLRSKPSFTLRFMDRLRFVPELPGKDDWASLVNSWIKGAEVVSMGPDADAEHVLRESVLRIIADLFTGGQVEDLYRHMAVPLDGGGVGFKADAVLARLLETGSETERSDVCRVLNELGYKSSTARIGGTPARVWRKRE